MVNLTRGAWAGEMDKTSAITIFPGPIPQSPHDFSLSNAKKSRIKDLRFFPDFAGKKRCSFVAQLH